MKTNQRFIALVLLAALFISNFATAQERQSIFKRKWNPEAKGVAIGAIAGGAAGAIIHKRNRKVGAGVGMAAGAAAGYGVGKIISNKQKRAAAAARAAEQREYAARTAPAPRAESRSRSVARRAAVPAAAAVGAGAGYVLAQNATAEAEVPTVQSLVRNGYLLNTDYGDNTTAYPTSEYRRKSW